MNTGHLLSAPQASKWRAPGVEGEKSLGDLGSLPGNSGSSALLQAYVLEMDENEDDLELFSKVRVVATHPTEVPHQDRELAAPPGSIPVPLPCCSGGWALGQPILGLRASLASISSP